MPKWKHSDAPRFLILIIAFQKGNAEIIESLIQAGADLNVLNYDNYTPLAYANKYILQKLNLVNGTTIVQNRFAKVNFNYCIVSG